MKKIFLLLITVILLAGCGPVDSATVIPQAAQESAAAQQSLFLHGRSFLPQDQLALYDALAQAALDFDTAAEIAVPAGIDDAQLAQLALYIGYDYPQLYWVKPELLLKDGRRVMRLAPIQGMTAELAKQRQQEIDRAAESFLRDIAEDSFAIVTLVHDRLVEQVGRDTSGRADSGNIYGALVQKSAICDGYAKAFQYLMMRKGVDCIYYQGKTLRGTPHAWNAVYIADSWYFVDVTWDTLTAGRVLHLHVNITREELERERIFDAGQYPQIVNADSTAYNYYKHLGYAVSPQDTAQLATQLAQGFVEQLKSRSFTDTPTSQYLELKVYATPALYEQVRDSFVQNPFLVLQEMDRIAAEQNLPFMVSTQGEISCNYKDVMQVLIFLPKVKGLEEGQK